MINLYSDTQTQPSPAMRRAMAEAPVGDEQRRMDPTVLRLQEMAAELLGKESALFLPSGTMCNLIAVKAHTKPGDAVLIDRWAHIVRHESGAHGMVSGVFFELLDGDRGRFKADQAERVIPAQSSVYDSPPTLVCVEQTHNFGGGSVWPIDRIREVCAVAGKHRLATHLDGARLLNAVVASGVSAGEYAKSFDSAWIDLTKGLGCPVGAVLAGSRAFIETALRYKQALGGAMRQAGIIAAAGIYALRHNVGRLADDHENAQILARGLSRIDGIDLKYGEPETNIVYFDVSRTGMAADEFTRLLEARGVSMSEIGGAVRAVTHLDVSRADVEKAIEIVAKVCRTERREGR
ncbi:MAG: aminotransferase class I/II-fold pyridoxal phosphate-dependent enzyme [Planctomycetes bacterium]|nr:aminotransferase class I/II-fold pyridoxal phosphate-dependent enzyme [Planctomycetota bacterium]